MFSWNSTKRPVVALAPMDGYTDSAFRQLVKNIDSRVICYTEFLSSDYFFHKPKEAEQLLAMKKIEEPLIVQLFGKEPEHFAVAAKIAENCGAAGIDINMGCPAKKVVNSMHGSYLMKNVDLGCRIIESIKKEINIPLSVKTRRGWEDHKNLISFVKQLESAGIDMIAIHGRTYSQHFKGEALWEPIYGLKENINIPVIGNGDVRSWKTAKEKIGNLDGVMVGRATMGNPWLLHEIAQYFYDGIEWDSTTSVSLEEKLRVMIEHTQLLVETKGQRRGTLEARKHMAIYIRGIENAAKFRSRLVRIESLQELKRIVTEIAEQQSKDRTVLKEKIII